ncbi:hypothetical protein [Streptomyces sp. CB02923]|uniref:hypothetical protein n=1 Tax=Streptomyces sp. CB02923 TaxID=1718985 RepID=UPI000AE48136|nr:hypothetical protein [Streptomyces sp. CB02923]
MPDTPVEQPVRRLGRRFFKPVGISDSPATDRPKAEAECEREYFRPELSADLLDRLGAELDRIKATLWSQHSEAEYGTGPRRC